MAVATLLLLISILGVGIARHQSRAALDRAYAMMDDADRLKVDENTLAEALLFVKRFQGETRSSKPTGTCQPSDCLAETNVLSGFYSRHTWLIPLVKRVGVHVFEFDVTLWIKNDKLIARENIFFVPRAVGADVYVATIMSAPDERIAKHPSYQLHPGFATSFRDFRGTPEFTYWKSASMPGQAPTLPRMSLDCVTTLDGCNMVAQILPAAWAQHQADTAKIELEKRSTSSK